LEEEGKRVKAAECREGGRDGKEGKRGGTKGWTGKGRGRKKGEGRTNLHS